jgi:hypothetical protein
VEVLALQIRDSVARTVEDVLSVWVTRSQFIPVAAPGSSIQPLTNRELYDASSTPQA